MDASTDATDPYAPPVASLGDGRDLKSETVLARRLTRLAAAIVDSIIGMVFSLPLMFYLGVFEGFPQQEISQMTTVFLALGGFAAFLLLHGYLLANYGQTIGKRLLKIRIVRPGGAHAEFNRLIMLRYLPLTLVSLIPFVGQILTMVDVLFIFREDRRCLHDRIADTVVVQVLAP